MEVGEKLRDTIIGGFVAIVFMILIVSVYKYNIAEMEKEKVFSTQGLEQKLDGVRVIWVKVKEKSNDTNTDR
jgi:hypothetical protein